MTCHEKSIPRVSVVVRCYNEDRHIERLLQSLNTQSLKDIEIIVVDSGSTDRSLDIVHRYPVKVLCIEPEEFTFGRALNLGCAEAEGAVLVFASAHVYPERNDWLERMCAPFADRDVGLVYGRQIGNHLTRFSEHQVFAQLFPEKSTLDQEGPFCNNANAAIRKDLWREHRFDEALTGLEDLEWGQWVRKSGYRIVYDAAATIVHVHEETPRRIFHRYKREAIALQRLISDSHLTLVELGRFLGRSIAVDVEVARRQRKVLSVLPEILMFRTMQYFGTYAGLHHRTPVTQDLIMKFYYPQGPEGNCHGYGGAPADEGALGADSEEELSGL